MHLTPSNKSALFSNRVFGNELYWIKSSVSGMWRCDVGRHFPTFLRNVVLSSARVKQSRNNSPNDTVSHPRRPESSAIPLYEHKILYWNCLFIRITKITYKWWSKILYPTSRSLFLQLIPIRIVVWTLNADPTSKIYRHKGVVDSAVEIRNFAKKNSRITKHTRKQLTSLPIMNFKCNYIQGLE
jgi:hypothetical protein